MDSKLVLYNTLTRRKEVFEPLVGKDCQAGQAYMNICHRILGEEVPYLNLEATNGLFQKLKAIFKK